MFQDYKLLSGDFQSALQVKLPFHEKPKPPPHCGTKGVSGLCDLHSAFYISQRQ